FFIFSVILYGIIFFVNPELFYNSWNNFLQMAYKIISLLLVLIFPIMFLLNYFVKPEKIKKYFGKQVGFKADLYTTIAGILIVGPPYVLYPMLGDLKKNGMSNRALAIFLYNRNVKIPFIPVMIFYFGLAFTIILSILIIIFGFLSGRIIDFFVEE
ncbi:MAG: hypothetical protein PF549_04845, partial [Patescibacteria group bacterium]|nr:hypothetical protein [Patescibacteria group bacterium]